MSDEDYVIACDEWVTANRDSCTVNYKYHRLNMPTGQPLPDQSLFLISGTAAITSANSNDDIIANDQILKLQRQYTDLTANFNEQSKDWPHFQQKTILDLLASCSASSQQMQLDYLTRHPATNSDPMAFEDLLAQAFVIRLTESNNITALTSLLASRCPEAIEVSDLEFWLAYEKGPAALLILTSAYSAAGTNYSSQVLLSCLGRAFPSMRHDNVADAEFVKACEKWVRTNQTSCALNYDYHPINDWQFPHDTELFFAPMRTDAAPITLRLPKLGALQSVWWQSTEITTPTHPAYRVWGLAKLEKSKAEEFSRDYEWQKLPADWTPGITVTNASLSSYDWNRSTAFIKDCMPALLSGDGDLFFQRSSGIVYFDFEVESLAQSR